MRRRRGHPTRGCPLSSPEISVDKSSLLCGASVITSLCLQGKVSCQVFFSEKGGAKFSKRQRREIFDWIKDLSCAILSQLGKPGKRAAQAAWRLAVESWLHVNGFIEVSVNGKVLPIFPPNLSH